MTEEERLRGFLKELTILSRKYGVAIGACPGAGYPCLDIETREWPECEYVVDKPADHFETGEREASCLQYVTRDGYSGRNRSKDDIWSG